MKRTCATILIMVFGTCVISLAVTAQATPKLEVMPKLVESNYCLLDQLRLQLRISLVYKNAGEQPLILSKQQFIHKRLIGQSPKDLLAKKYESIGTSMFSVTGWSTEEKILDTATYVVLGPGDTWETGEFVLLPLRVSTGNDSSKRKGLPTGGHFLQVIVNTYPFLDDPDKIQARGKGWLGYGYLWVEDINSLPMPFTVEVPENHVTSNCKPVT